jgi:aminoglycoside/choline kinase family phosphotransferase
MMLEDLRTLAMLDWLENDLLLIINRCERISGDASFRRYFRINTPEGDFMVMDAPPEKENIEAFIRIAELLTHFQVHVPAIYKKNIADGFLLLEDFGSEHFFDSLTSENADDRYQYAFDSLFKLQSQASQHNLALPCYNEDLLQRELTIFNEWFLQNLLDTEIEPSLWHRVNRLLIDSALEQPTICVHRDYHSRNLMILNGDSFGVIDFQDAVIGPITYDLVSLLRDCYIAWPEEKVQGWLAQYYQRLIDAKLLACDLAQFKRWFDLMGLQRHLKAIGIFSRLYLRDERDGYLKHIPLTLNYVATISQKYPELTEFNQFIVNQVLPKHSAFVVSYPSQDQ